MKFSLLMSFVSKILYIFNRRHWSSSPHSEPPTPSFICVSPPLKICLFAKCATATNRVCSDFGICSRQTIILRYYITCNVSWIVSMNYLRIFFFCFVCVFFYLSLLSCLCNLFVCYAVSVIGQWLLTQPAINKSWINLYTADMNNFKDNIFPLQYHIKQEFKYEPWKCYCIYRYKVARREISISYLTGVGHLHSYDSEFDVWPLTRRCTQARMSI